MINVNLCISGFTQDESYEHGVWRLSEQMLKQANGDSLRNRVWLRRWNSDWKAIAEQLFLLDQKYGVRIAVYAYSWGAGYGATKLAHYLNARGVKIKYMVLCDPVYRSRTWCFRWRSMLSRNFFLAPVIRIAPNVEYVKYFYQRHNRPQSHIVRAIDPKATKVANPVELKRSHQYMDDSKEWWTCCLAFERKLHSMENK